MFLFCLKNVKPDNLWPLYAGDLPRAFRGVLPLMGTLAVGVSMPVHHLSELAVAYEQALFAVNADTSGGIRRSSDYALAFLLRLISENKMSAFLRHPAISVLENYDAKNRTDLLMTLKTYLQQSCSQNRTAEALHVHLNSLKYRLRRIVELTGLNLHDSEELLYLQLSLRIGPRASIEPGNVC